MSWKDLIFEDDPSKAAKTVPPTTKTQTQQRPEVPAPVPIPASVPQNVDVSIGTSSAYTVLAKRSDFEATEAGTILMKYLKPLRGVPMTDEARYRAAFAQAKALDGLTLQGVIDAFDSLLKFVQGETDSFRERVKASTAQISDKLSHQQELKNQIALLQKQYSDLDEEIVNTKAKISKALDEFDQAVTTRELELQTQKQQFVAMFK